MTPAAPRLVDVNAAPESVLPAALAARLPDTTPAAPWSVRAEAILWWHRAAPAAAAVVPDALSEARSLPLTIGAMVRYLDTPVGAYSEIVGVPRLVLGGGAPAATIPFIAVDSLASVAAGRAHWALPKVLASFSWLGLESVQASGDGWSVGLGVRLRGPALPIAAAFPVLQPFPDETGSAAGTVLRRSTVRGAGRARPASVTVSTTGTSLPLWLTPGRFAGVVLPSVRAVIGAPRQ